jgi:CubicO group peptidase (beta-lactamase class C family)
MQLVEQGVVNLDDPAYIHIDPFLKATNGTPFVEL